MQADSCLNCYVHLQSFPLLETLSIESDQVSGNPQGIADPPTALATHAGTSDDSAVHSQQVEIPNAIPMNTHAATDDMRLTLDQFGLKSAVGSAIPAEAIARKLAPVVPQAAEAELVDLSLPTRAKVKAADSIFDGWESDGMSDLLAELLVSARP